MCKKYYLRGKRSLEKDAYSLTWGNLQLKSPKQAVVCDHNGKFIAKNLVTTESNNNFAIRTALIVPTTYKRKYKVKI